MTEDYRNRLFSRISRLNYTNYTNVKRILLLSLLCIVSITAGYIATLFFGEPTASINLILTSHFCGFFNGLGTLDCIRAAITFAAPDLAAMLILFVLGYTMLAGFGCKLVILCHCAKLGFCGGLIYEFLIAKPHITGEISAFIMFSICKLSVLTAIIISAIQSEDFSYSYGEIFGKNAHPFRSDRSIKYIKAMISTAGFTALINTIYLIFQSLQSHLPL